MREARPRTIKKLLERPFHSSTIFTLFFFFFLSHLWPIIVRPSRLTGDTRVPNEGRWVVGVAAKTSLNQAPLCLLSSVIAGGELWVSKQAPMEVGELWVCVLSLTLDNISRHEAGRDGVEQPWRQRATQEIYDRALRVCTRVFVCVSRHMKPFSLLS